MPSQAVLDFDHVHIGSPAQLDLSDIVRRDRQFIVLGADRDGVQAELRQFDLRGDCLGNFGVGLPNAKADQPGAGIVGLSRRY